LTIPVQVDAPRDSKELVAHPNKARPLANLIPLPCASGIMMDPVSAITVIAALVKSIRYLVDVSECMRQNRQECQGLANHAEEVLKLVEFEVERGTSPDVLKGLQKLQQYMILHSLSPAHINMPSSTLHTLNSTLEALPEKPRLKKILWRSSISEQIGASYRALSEAISLFNVSSIPSCSQF
jgi:hypothetical protein